MSSFPSRPVRGFTVFLGITCAVLAVQVLALSSRNRALRAQLGEQQAAAEDRPQRARLRIGDAFTPFHLRAADGSERRVAFDSWATLLLVFAEECPACPLVYPEWEALVEPFEAASVPVLGLRLDPEDAERPAEQGDHPFPVFTLTDAREVPLAELATVPSTILLDEAGRVLWCRYGTLTDEQRAELLAFAGT